MTPTRMFIAVIALAAAVGGFFAARSYADQPGAEGTIVAVESIDHKIRVDIGGDEAWFRCTESTVITLNGYAATFDQLTAGQPVKVWFDQKTYEAQRIEAIPRARD